MGLILFLIFGWFYLLFRIGFSLLRFLGSFFVLLLVFFILAKVIILGLWLSGIAVLALVGWLVYRSVSGQI